MPADHLRLVFEKVGIPLTYFQQILFFLQKSHLKRILLPQIEVCYFSLVINPSRSIFPNISQFLGSIGLLSLVKKQFLT